MTQDNRESGRRALEEEFFARQNQALIQKLKEEKTRAETLEQLSRFSGIKDEEILGQLMSTGLTASTIVALTYVPLVLTAWADGTIDTEERAAILKAVAEQGIDANNPAYELIQSWLGAAPGPRMFETWKAYIKGLRETMDHDSYATLKLHILQRTRSVAESAGGFLGLGSKVSASERALIVQLENAFS